ncbi:MAG: hypothetical protein M1834_007533 [Cirrosporium novae-zelandiae]|nr:MAG: hypothetical protein M1834_007533 [Cirrosporium novae-zelandiae]
METEREFHSTTALDKECFHPARSTSYSNPDRNQFPEQRASGKLHFLRTNFDKWIDEDEQDTAPEDDYMNSFKTG